MVKTELAEVPPGMSEPGANEHFKVLGSPEQESATALLNEPDGDATLTVRVPEPPGVIVIAFGFAPRVKLELPPVLVPQPRSSCTAEDISFVRVGFPTA